MNIMTYVVPVSMHPKHYILAIYRDTHTLANWLYAGSGILQILAPVHAPLVRTLGKKSGSTYDKMTYLSRKNLLTTENMLVDIAGYIHLEQIQILPDSGGDHILVLCRVCASRSYSTDVLSTHTLVEQGCIL
jgi:flavin reductase (DIM6/NTAB) family NADH-FMN oxidoreductase RutF